MLMFRLAGSWLAHVDTACICSTSKISCKCHVNGSLLDEINVCPFLNPSIYFVNNFCSTESLLYALNSIVYDYKWHEKMSK